MGVYEDSCDFCDCFIDPMGGDTAQVTDGFKYWCGQCTEGALHVFGYLNNRQLQQEIETAQNYLEENLPQSEYLRVEFFKRNLETNIRAMKNVLAERKKSE